MRDEEMAVLLKVLNRLSSLERLVEAINSNVAMVESRVVTLEMKATKAEDERQEDDAGQQ